MTKNKFTKSHHDHDTAALIRYSLFSPFLMKMIIRILSPSPLYPSPLYPSPLSVLQKLSNNFLLVHYLLLLSNA